MNREVINVTWRGPADLDEREAYLIATYLRLDASNGKTYGDRNFIAPTQLTAERAERIAQAFAYFRDMVRLHDLKTIDDIDSYVESHSIEEAELWVAENWIKVELGLSDLMKIVGKFSCFG